MVVDQLLQRRAGYAAGQAQEVGPQARQRNGDNLGAGSEQVADQVGEVIVDSQARAFTSAN